MSDEIDPKADAADPVRETLSALLRDVTAQRDKLLSQYEAMAQQVDESTREVDDAKLQAQEAAQKAEASEHRATEQTARADELARQQGELTRQLEEERRRSAGATEELARLRAAAEQAPSAEDPRDMLWRALSLIAQDCVAWTRAKIPPDSPLLPWFDRAVELATKAGCQALQWAKAFLEWATPRAIELWKRLKSEVAQRVRKE